VLAPLCRRLGVGRVCCVHCDWCVCAELLGVCLPICAWSVAQHRGGDVCSWLLCVTHRCDILPLTCCREGRKEVVACVKDRQVMSAFSPVHLEYAFCPGEGEQCGCVSLSTWWLGAHSMRSAG
jgi:hypothetical protein